MPRAGLLRLDLHNPSGQTTRPEWEASQPFREPASRETTKQALPDLNLGRQSLDTGQILAAGGC